MTEDIDADSSKEQENNNMDWKKKGFDKHERLTLKINLEEAIRRQSNNKIQKNETRNKLRAKPVKNKPFRKNKIRTSIYDDEDEDEEEYILLPVFNNLPKFSLEKALTPKEKLQLDQMEKEPKQPKSEQIQLEQISRQNIPTKENRTEQKNGIKQKLPKTNEKKQNEEFLEWDAIKDYKNPDKEPLIEDTKTQPNKEKEIAPTIKDIELLLAQEQEENLQNQKKSQDDARAMILEKSGRKNTLNNKPKKNKKDPLPEQKLANKNHQQENER